MEKSQSLPAHGWPAAARVAHAFPFTLCLVLVTAPLGFAAQDPAPVAPALVETRKIWDGAAHNAFTDLVRFKERWFCVFREGQGHVSPDGAIRVLASTDGREWSSQACLTHARADLRDPKITITPKQKLMLTGAAAWHQPAPFKHQTLAWFSDDGMQWGEPVEVGEPNLWLWRVTWHGNAAYGVGYDTTGEKFIRLYQSRDGIRFEPLVARLFEEGYPNETSLLFLEDQTALCLLRRDGNPGTGKLGSARPPYTEWTWKDLGVKLGGPHWIRLPDGRFVAAVRLYDQAVRTGLCWVDVQAGTLKEFLRLPSGGDTSYPGLAWHENLLWVSYYSSHEGKTSIYLAKIKP